MHRRHSEQSITASEDYYSLSSSQSSQSLRSHRRHGYDPHEAELSTATIQRYSTPPSRYRTPVQSREHLQALAAAQAQPYDNPLASNALRGPGQRRQSIDSQTDRRQSSRSRERQHQFGGMPIPLYFRDGGVRRKPVPSTVVEDPNSPTSTIRASQAPGAQIPSRGTAIDERSNFNSPPTPGPHDGDYVRFALDQLTRDEEVRGSRMYRGLGSGKDGNLPYLVADQTQAPTQKGPIGQASSTPSGDALTSHPYTITPLNVRNINRNSSDKIRDVLGEDPLLERQQRPYYAEEAQSPEVPLRNPRRKSTPTFHGQGSSGDAEKQEPKYASDVLQDPGVFLPLAADTGRPLHFVPGILRPKWLLPFILLAMLYTIALIFSAIWSRVNTGLTAYTGFGDGRYFVFRYLPTLLGTVLLFWLWQIQVAVTRVTPFIAMASSNPKTRATGSGLPISRTGFILPTLAYRYSAAGLPIIGAFELVAWLQIFTLPLLASSFNVYFLGAPDTGNWRWIATQGAIWTVIALYIFLLVMAVVLMVWLIRTRKTETGTGLKWDPKSLADLFTLLERSNALSSKAAEESDVHGEVPRLGLWRTSNRPNETFHTYGTANAAPRRYSLEDGRIRERSAVTGSDPHGHYAQPSDDVEAGAASFEKTDERQSKDAMLPGSAGSDSSWASAGSSISMPWFLRPLWTSLWVISAVVLLLAFLIVSYLPSTRVASAFEPDVSATVNRFGFSGTNFLYSFLPCLLGELCLLLWIPMDLSHRRIAPLLELLSAGSGKQQEGETAEKTLLVSYAADSWLLAPASALANGHWRVALFALISLIAGTLPILGGGVFWAQFYISQQRVRIASDMPAFYALTVFVTLFALAWLLLLPITATERRLSHIGNGGNKAKSFTDVLSLVRHSRILDDVAFHAPASKVDLVTRLLSAPVGARLSMHQGQENVGSKASLADSVRGFGNARQRALGGLGVMETPRYILGRCRGRDGRAFGGIDRVRG